MYSHFFKRLIDVIVSGFILLLMLPFLLIIAVLVKIESPGSIFFLQNRVGKNLSLFTVYKFRTMTNEKRTVGKKPVIGKAAGVTKFGYWLRRFKIDELPQLINVLKGDMSLVGPRPSIAAQLDDMTDEQKKRYSVRPGCTGLAQVSGNIHMNWERRYKFDLNYVRNITFTNDLKILFRTIFIIIEGEEKFINKPLKIKKHQ
ncbi:MAG: sugar transferase [Candidatus Cyclobacteriaceae bacterium M2_1C_046]